MLLAVHLLFVEAEIVHGTSVTIIIQQQGVNIPQHVIQVIGEDKHLGDCLNVADEIRVVLLGEARKRIEHSNTFERARQVAVPQLK